MAAIGHRIRASPWTLPAAGMLLVFVSAPPLRADRAADVRAPLSYIATALTSGNAADAMTPFDKSFLNYQKLSNYFQGLNAFQIDNELDVIDEQDTDTESKLTVNWTLTINDLATGATERRSGDINVRIVRKGGKWKIVDFSPISLFDPQQKPMPK